MRRARFATKKFFTKKTKKKRRGSAGRLRENADALPLHARARGQTVHHLSCRVSYYVITTQSVKRSRALRVRDTRNSNTTGSLIHDETARLGSRAKNKKKVTRRRLASPCRAPWRASSRRATLSWRRWPRRAPAWRRRARPPRRAAACTTWCRSRFLSRSS